MADSDLQHADCVVCGGRDLACPKCQPENWGSRWRAQRLRSYWAAVDALKKELGR